MYGKGDCGCTNEYRLVNCTLSELSYCSCSCDCCEDRPSSSRRKTTGINPVRLEPADMLSQLSAKQILLSRKPTLIDRLISQNKSALMEPRRKRRGPPSSKDKVVSESVGRGKHKSVSPQLQIHPTKRLRSSTKEDENAENLPKETVKRGRKENNNKAKELPQQQSRKSKVFREVEPTNRYVTRISSNKVRIPFSLRSGRKMADILKQKRSRLINFTQLGPVVRKKKRIDTNSNVFNEEGNDKIIKNLVKVEEGKPELKKQKKVMKNRKLEQEQPVKKKRKKKKRCSMWVNKVKRVRKPKKEESEEEEDSEVNSLCETDTPKLHLEGTNSVILLKTESPKESNDERQLVNDITVQNPYLKEENASTQEQTVVANLIVINNTKSSDTEDFTEIRETKSIVNQENIESEEPRKIADIFLLKQEEKGSCDVKLDESNENKRIQIIEVIKDVEEKVLQSSPTASGVNSSGDIEQNNTVNDFHLLLSEKSSKICYEENSNIELKVNKELVKGILSEHIDKLTESETHDADSTSDVLKNSHDSSFGDLSLYLPEEELELLKPEVNISLSKVLPDSTKLIANHTLPNESILDREEIINNRKYFDNIEHVIEKSCDYKQNIEFSPKDIENEHNRDDIEQIDEKLLAEVQSQLEQQEILREKILFDNKTENSVGIVLKEENEEGEDKILSATLENNRDQVEIERVHFEIEDCDKHKNEELTIEQRQMKESVLQALGLKSLTGQLVEDKPKKSEGYTGTLKAVIKLNRSGDKKHKMVYKRNEDGISTSDQLEYRICSDVQNAQDDHDDPTLVDTNKTESSNLLYRNSSPDSPIDDIDSSQDDGKGSSGKESNLVIPEKSSSFSIHPGRLCSDVCSYCFGKFGSLDTPCHVAQLKGEERQKKILENETHLTGESCLCDACYRYVDRKANCPSKTLQGNSGSGVRSRLSQSAECCVTGCKERATRTMKRKWLIKLKKSINNKLDIDTEKPGHGVYYPLCTQHHNWVEYFTVCGICRKRLNRNNLFSLGLETDRLNLMLAEDGIPARLSDNLFLCKLCRYYSDLRLKYTDTEAIPPDKKAFYRGYRRKILMSLDIPLSESDDDSIKDIQQRDIAGHQDELSTSGETLQGGKVGSIASSDIGSKHSTEDVMSLHGLATLFGEQPQQQARIQVKFGNVNIGTLSNLNIGQQGHSGSSKNGPQTENSNGNSNYSETALSAQLQYQGSSTPDGSWERYTSTIMFDKKTKQLWTELQRPYGNQSSFLRHLVMLEKVWRAGFLTLVPGADEIAVKYITSAQNRILAFEGEPNSTNSKESQDKEAKLQTLPQQQQQQQQQPETKPPVTIVGKPSHPLLTNTGEIEVTAIKGKQQKVSQSNQTQISDHTRQPSIIPTFYKQQCNLTQHLKIQSQQHQLLQHQKRITPLDRAKSLVRMASPPHIRHNLYQQQMYKQRPNMIGLSRFYNQQQSNQSQPPPLLKLGQAQQTCIQNRPILPKLPRALTVVSMPAGSSNLSHQQTALSAITLRHSGITIEKQSAPARHHLTPLPIEKPSISVFREPSSQP